MKTEPPYSPILWGAIAIPIISATELFIDPETRTSFSFFVLGSFYLASVRYTLAVCLGVFGHDRVLESVRDTKKGPWLWLCYFLVLLFCSLLVPGVAIFGLTTTLVLTFAVVVLSFVQGVITIKNFSGDAAHLQDVKWRIFLDMLLLIFLALDVIKNYPSPSLQSVFMALAVLLVVDFTITPFAKDTLGEMWSGLSHYLADSTTKGE